MDELPYDTATLATSMSVTSTGTTTGGTGTTTGLTMISAMTIQPRSPQLSSFLFLTERLTSRLLCGRVLFITSIFQGFCELATPATEITTDLI